MLTELIKPFPGAEINWSFEPSWPRWDIVPKRWAARRSKGPAPTWKAVVPAAPARRWLLYFIFLPDGKLTPAHIFTLERLAAEEANLMLICTCPEGDPVLGVLKERCDALYWKAANGWDFSAYALGLSELARLSPGADVLVMNDSVFGPFVPVVPLLDAAPWRLTGFTCIAQDENHIQSYAFMIKDLRADVLEALAPVMSTEWSYNNAGAVILLQETRMARVAARQLTVGSCWYAKRSKQNDLCLFRPKELLEAGFPFFKRSHLGKFARVFQDPAEMRKLLTSLGHPLP